jgi:hypothetical protein
MRHALLKKSPVVFTLALCAMAAYAASDWSDWRNWKYNDEETIQRSFTLSGSSDPKKLLVDNISGYIHVNGAGGNSVKVSVKKRIDGESNAAVQEAKRDVKLDISQLGNSVRLYEDGPFRNGNNRGEEYYGYHVNFDYDIEVPSGTTLVLKTINNGEIVVKGTTGDFDVHGLNGGIDMEDITGAGNIQTLNGKLKVSFRKNPDRDTTFKTLNGGMDVYFQPGVNADLHMKTLNGGVYSDFDVSPLPITVSGNLTSGKYVYRSNRTTTVRAGKGGPVLTFDGLNGSIRLHSKGN